MASTSILDWDLDIRPYFGVTACDENADLLKLAKNFAESYARKFVGHGIIQTTYTNEYQRRFQIGGDVHYEMVQMVGDTVYSGRETSSLDGHILQLDNGFVRSITDLREDANAYFGQGTSDFGASTALTEGTDFNLEMKDDNFSKTGRVIRINRDWSSKPGTVRITYSAGLTSSELSNEYLFVKAALLDDMEERYVGELKRRASRESSGPIKKEVYHGDYTVEYDVSGSVKRLSSDLSQKTKQELQPIRRMSL